MTKCLSVGTMESIRVLFVENDKKYREIVGDELSERGFVIQSFGFSCNCRLDLLQS